MIPWQSSSIKEGALGNALSFENPAVHGKRESKPCRPVPLSCATLRALQQQRVSARGRVRGGHASCGVALAGG